MANNKFKFDVIIGNPPYQEEISGNNHQAKPIYHLFMDSAYKIGNIVEFITPARFLSLSGATPKKWDKKILNSSRIKIDYFNADSTKVFNNVDIKGGVVVTHYDVSAKYSPIGIFIPDIKLRNIYLKVAKQTKEKISDHVYSPDSYRFTDKMFEEYPQLIGRTDKSHAKALASSVFTRYPEIFMDKKVDDSVTIIGRLNNQRTSLYIKRRYLKDPGSLETYKLLIPGASGKGAYGEQLAKPIIAGPGEAHTQTFMCIGDLLSQFEVESLLRYVKSKFLRSLLGIMKTTQNNQARRTWSLIPWQNFSDNSDIDWSKSIHEIDLQLYKKYGLNKQEIEFIETHVKEMN